MTHHTHVTHHSGGLGGDLAHTFAHSVTSAFAWRGVGALFHHAAGLGILIAVVLGIATVIYFLTRRRTQRSTSTAPLAQSPHRKERP